jgi:hypothetical protein
MNNFYRHYENVVILKILYLLFLLPLVTLPASSYLEVLPSDKETLNVGIVTIPENPTVGGVVKFQINFINPKNDKIQEHIDYKFTLQKDGVNVFGPIPLTHTSTGSVTIPVEVNEPGNYVGLVEIEGILFQPIPSEFVSFSIPIADAQIEPSPAIDGNGGCLIATATFGSELSPQVQQLRELRDNVVLKTKSGVAFMNAFNQFYYSFSPAISDIERNNIIFKEMVRFTITPLISSLSILNYVDIDSEEEMLGYGTGIILLNIGTYFAIPAFVITKWYKFRIK